MMTLKLYKNFPINDYENQVYYASESARDSAFDSYTDKTFKNLSSCDKTKQTIRLNVPYYVGNKYNYGCIIEDNKRYYIFISVVEWLSNNTVILHYTYDYWQTYYKSITFKPSFVEREHVSDDTFGKHILDENLPISDYIIQGNENLDIKANEVMFCMTVSDNEYVREISDTNRKVPIAWNYGTGVTLLVLAFDNYEDAMNCIKMYVNNNDIDSIQGLFVCSTKSHCQPCYVMNGDGSGQIQANYVLPNYDYETESVTNITNFGGYVPNNNKCFCYPYSFVNITNYIGASIKAKYEFSNDKNTIKFKYNFPNVEGVGANGYLYEYDGLTHNLDYSISGFVNPELPYVTNQFSAYLSANANSINNTKNWIENDWKMNTSKGLINYGFQSASDLATGNVAGAIEHGTGLIMGQVDANMKRDRALDSINSSLADQSSKGDIAHGGFNPNILTNLGRIGFQMQKMRVTTECIQTIDHYLSMFGYKVNIIKTPQFTSRKRWNYLKTSGINLIGNVPQDALDTIKNMFNRGVTIWHSLGYMYNYDFDDNGVV